ncbi:amidophosphoribosyltransferase [Phorcysia thermohydrogeniphila]|uniref:Amidophosphoribosyltransferase n=1 Tax=Phorcysia thermohydrogeniphila TaxID=936138 RepID=A0A4R1GQ39_9BACT|nr:amidophosphoribosyltransferase [Phorcysia thermohydrogeniphila]TCK06632.1 amidophosphoribosyltransferase [Phorcysia thermohydrogeniphila]
MKEYCGIFGIYDNPNAAYYTYLGLYALQHRGQESAGIAVTDGKRITYYRDFGLVSSVFKSDSLKKLTGHTAIGHNRYSTSGASDSPDNIQPIVVSYKYGQLAIAHNGNLVNALELREKLEEEGSIFRGTTDSEVIVHLIVKSRKKKFLEKLIDALSKLKGAYSLLVMTNKKLIAARDPWGFRPLCMGELNGSPVFASETCAFDLIGARYIRDVEPGEIVVVENGKVSSLRLPGSEKCKKSQCIFEFIYFARPDSRIFGKSVYEVRKEFGRILAREYPVEADLVIPVPDSGVVPALGYSQESGIPFEMGLIRNHYVGRTFIKPEQKMRDIGVKVKLNPIPELLKGKRIVVIDDSIVRGTTSRKIIRMLREAGAKEVHMRISSPPTKWPCYFGIDTPTRDQLIASSYSVEEICKFIEADSLGYLSLEGMLEATCGSREEFCTACFDGKYPVDVPERIVEQSKKK